MKIKEYKELILKHRFFEAHEVLEEFWFPRRRQKDDLTLVIKGFINAAVSLELYKRERVENSNRVWQVYLKFAKKIDNLESKELRELRDFVDEFRSSYIKL